MRVLQITKWFLPYKGGVETTVQQIAEGLMARAVETRVLTCHRHFNLRNAGERVGRLPVARAHSLGNLFSTPVSPAFPALYRRHAQWADVLHFHEPFPLAALVQALATSSDKKVVVTFHADPTQTRWGALSRLYRPILDRLLDRADQVVVTSPPLKASAPSLRAYQEKCRVIPLATRLKVGKEPAGKQALKRRLGLEAGFVVLGVGRMVYYKGFQYLLEAMAKVDGQLVLVGKGDDLDELRARARALGVAERVHFSGFVPDEALTRYYAAADAFALPSITPAEAFGIVQVEAMAHGLPVVNTALPTGVPFVSQDGKTGFTVPPRDAGALAEALNRLRREDALRARLGRNAAARARLFTTDAMVDRYLEVYNALLAGGPVRSDLKRPLGRSSVRRSYKSSTATRSGPPRFASGERR